MAGAEQDPLRESIEKIASSMDVDAIIATDEIKDPVLNILRDELIMGSGPEEALEEVTERLRKLCDTVLAILDFPPNALHSYPFSKKLEVADLTPDEMDAAVSVLQNLGKIGQINGWWFRKPEPLIRPEDLSNDDVDWLLGIGRYGQ